MVWFSEDLLVSGFRMSIDQFGIPWMVNCEQQTT
jgi:hypothetical protein